MPYARKYARKTRYARPRKSLRMKATDAHIRAVAKAAIKQQSEMKIVAYHGGPTTIPSAGYLLGLTDIPQATTTQTDTVRVGDQVRPMRLQINLMLNNTSGTVPDKSRITVIKWHGGYGLDPATFAKVFFGAPYTISQFNYDTGPSRMRKYTVVYDKFVDNPQVGLAVSSAVQNGYQIVQIDLKCTGTVDYQAASTTDCAGGYYILMSSWQGVAQFEIYSLLTFMDI